MFDENYFAGSDANPTQSVVANAAEQDVDEFDKYRSSGDTEHDGRSSSSSDKQQQLVDAASTGVVSETPGYEGMPTEDAVVSSLVTRQWAQNQLAGPREDFRRTNYGANGRGALHPQQPAPLAAALLPTTTTTVTTEALSSQRDSLRREPPTDAHKPLAYYERDDGSMNEREPRNVPQLTLTHLDDAYEHDGQSAPRQPSAPSPSLTPRAGTRGRASRTRHTDASQPPPLQHGYSHVRSVLADYMSGNITELEARYGAARAATPVGDGRGVGVSSSTGATPRQERSLRPGAKSPAPRTPLRRGSSASQRKATPVRGAPRCASIIPERMRYVPKEARPPPPPTKEEKEAEEAFAVAEADREQVEKSRRVARAAAQRVAERTGSARPRARTPISYREGDASPVNPSRKKSRKLRSTSTRQRTGSASPRSQAKGSSDSNELQSRFLQRADGSADEEKSARLPVKAPRRINPFGYRKQLLFPTNAPTVSTCQ